MILLWYFFVLIKLFVYLQLVILSRWAPCWYPMVATPSLQTIASNAAATWMIRGISLSRWCWVPTRCLLSQLKSFVTLSLAIGFLMVPLNVVRLKCMRAQGVPATNWAQCPSTKCGNLSLGESVNLTTCLRTTCDYAGYNERRILTVLTNQSTCTSKYNKTIEFFLVCIEIIGLDLDTMELTYLDLNPL